MIHPEIALGYKPVEAPDMAQAQAKGLSLRNLAMQGQLQQQQLANEKLVAQQHQMALDAAKATNDALQRNTMTGADGSVSINHEGVVQTLTRAGQGQAAMAYQRSHAALQEQLTKSNNEQLTGMGRAHEILGGYIGSVISAAPEQKQGAWTLVRNRAITEKLATAQEIPEAVPDDATLTTMRLSMMDGKAQIEAAQRERATKASEAQATIAQQRADDQRSYNDQRLLLQKDTDDRLATTAERASRHQSTLENQGERRLGLEERRVVNEENRVGPTGTASLADKARNVAEVDRITKEEASLNTLRSRLGAAMKAGTYYLNTAGNSVAYDADGNKLTEDGIAAKKSDMRKRYDETTARLKVLVSQKNDAITRNGGTPQVSADQAAAALDGGSLSSLGKPKASGPQPAPAQATQTKAPVSESKIPAVGAAPKYLKFARNAKGDRQGFNAATNKWEAIKSQ
jgi:hypothetical protein